MQRFRWFEIHDQRWCPRSLRDTVTDFLQSLSCRLGYFRAILPRLQSAMERAGSRNIVDLGSGGGGPWLSLLRTRPAQAAPDWSVQLTDLYPNTSAFERSRHQSAGRISYVDAPVDARDVPACYPGARTIFGALHHFQDRDVELMVRDAVGRGELFASFEAQGRRPSSILSVCLLPLAAIVLTPFLRPFRFRRLFWTYLLPLAPLIIGFDGLVSCQRTQSPLELRRIVDRIDAPGYVWEIGDQTMERLPLSITYLIGIPGTSSGLRSRSGNRMDP